MSFLTDWSTEQTSVHHRQTSHILGQFIGKGLHQEKEQVVSLFLSLIHNTFLILVVREAKQGIEQLNPEQGKRKKNQ